MKNKDNHETVGSAFDAFSAFCEDWKNNAPNFVHCSNCPCLKSRFGCFNEWLFKEVDDVDTACRERRAALTQSMCPRGDEGAAHA